jgi:hypothetical protein
MDLIDDEIKHVDRVILVTAEQLCRVPLQTIPEALQYIVECHRHGWPMVRLGRVLYVFAPIQGAPA